MLTYVVEKFETSAEEDEATLADVVLYANTLVTEGFLAREKHVVYHDRGRNAICLAGLVCHHSAMRDSRSVSRLRLHRERVESRLVSKPSVESHVVAASEDDFYCDHEGWDSLRLVCDEEFGASPIVCNECDGSVARYRLRQSSSTASSLWHWDTQYRHISACWLASAEYESWARRELFDVRSRLNELGMKAARALAAETHCEVLYTLATECDQRHDRCPHCQGSFRRVSVAAWNALCPACRILTIQR